MAERKSKPTQKEKPQQMEQPPACEKCGGPSKPTWIGPWSRQSENFHDLGDVITGPIYRYWCERCDAGVGAPVELGKRKREGGKR